MTWSRSSSCSRRRHADGDSPTCAASAALLMRPSSCNRRTMCWSISSRDRICTIMRQRARSCEERPLNGAFHAMNAKSLRASLHILSFVPSTQEKEPMRIGVPKEIKDLEFRVGLVPGAARELTALGHEVFVETRAGAGIGYDDEAYVAAG